MHSGHIQQEYNVFYWNDNVLQNWLPCEGFKNTICNLYETLNCIKMEMIYFSPTLLRLALSLHQSGQNWLLFFQTKVIQKGINCSSHFHRTSTQKICSIPFKAHERTIIFYTHLLSLGDPIPQPDTVTSCVTIGKPHLHSMEIRYCSKYILLFLHKNLAHPQKTLFSTHHSLIQGRIPPPHPSPLAMIFHPIHHHCYPGSVCHERYLGNQTGSVRGQCF